MPCLGRRLAEVFLFEIVLAVIFTCILDSMLVTVALFFFSLLACLIANIVFMFFCLRGYYFSTPPHYYYKVNLTVYAIFAVITIIAVLFDIEPFFTYLFFPYKLLVVFKVRKIVSTLVVNGIFFLEILLVPSILRRL